MSVGSTRKHYLKPAQIKKIRKALQDGINEIEQRSRQQLLELTERESNNAADEMDAAGDEATRLLELRLRDRESKVLPKMYRALERLDRGDFGYCEGCTSEIGFDRLLARPVAEFCIDCKTEMERGERRGAVAARMVGAEA